MKNNATHLEDEVQIDAPIEFVFEYLTDFSNTSKWHKNMNKVGWKSAGPHKVGSEYEWIETFAGIRMDLSGVITSWDPPFAFAWKPVNSPYPLTGGWTLSSQGRSTLVTRYSDNQLSGIYKWLNFLMLPMARRQVHKELQALKRLIETEAYT